MVKEIDYDSFGNIVAVVGVAFTPLFLYTGRLFDAATGLQNNLHRWYDPVVGRWVSIDPIGFEGGDANLYRYVGNSPTNATDPSGEYWSWNPFNWFKSAPPKPSPPTPPREPPSIRAKTREEQTVSSYQCLALKAI